MVGSCRAEVTDSPAGRCGNRSSARRIARAGRAAFNGKARCGSGRGVSASRGEGPGTGERRVSRQPFIPFIPCVGLRRACVSCVACVACLVGPCPAADERGACRVPAGPADEPGPGRQRGLGRVAGPRAAVGQPDGQPGGSWGAAARPRAMAEAARSSLSRRSVPSWAGSGGSPGGGGGDEPSGRRARHRR